MQPYLQSKDEVVAALDSNVHSGLSADQVSQKQQTYGPNKLKEKKKKTNFQRFIDQF